MKEKLFILTTAFLSPFLLNSCGTNEETLSVPEVEKPRYNLSGKNYTAAKFEATKYGLNTDSALLVDFKKYKRTSFIKSITETAKDTVVSKAFLGYDYTQTLSFTDEKNGVFQINYLTRYAEVRAVVHKYSCHFEETQYARISHSGGYEEIMPSKYTVNGKSFTLVPPFYFNFEYYSNMNVVKEWNDEKKLKKELKFLYTVDDSGTLTFTDKETSEKYIGRISSSGNTIHIDFKLDDGGYILEFR